MHKFSLFCVTGLSVLVSLLYSIHCIASSTKFEHFSVAEGLSNSIVKCVYQDSEKFLWFCTQDGLNKYDGYEFTVYRYDADDPHSISSSFVSDIIEDKDGKLWVATNYGLNHFDPKTEQFTHYFHDSADPNSLSENNTLSLLLDAQQELWISTSSQGINHFDPVTQIFTHYEHDPDDSNSLIGNEFYVYDSLYQDSQGDLWFASYGYGVSRFDKNTQTFKNYGSAYPENGSIDDSISAIREDSQQRIWLVSDIGLYELNLQTDQITLHLEGFSIYAIELGEDNSLWLGSGDPGYALIHYFPDTGEYDAFASNANDPYSLSNDFIYDIFKDIQNNIWLATWNGVNKFAQSHKFEHYYYIPGKENGLSDKDVFRFYETTNNEIWIATEGGGICQFFPELEEFSCYQHDENDPDNSLINDAVTSIDEDAQGHLWIATEGGVSQFNPQTENFINYISDEDDSNSLGSPYISCLTVDEEGMVWIGTWDAGLDRYDPSTNTFKHYQHQSNTNSLANNEVMYVMLDSKDTLWIGTNNGLNSFNRKTEYFKHYQHNKNDPYSISGNSITMIYEDQQQRLWVGTSGSGLNLFNPQTDTFERFSTKNIAIKNDTINGIMEDGQGNLWLTTNQGLSRFNPVTKEIMRNYDVADGLQGNDFTMGSVLASQRGNVHYLYAGGTNGFNRFIPTALKDNVNVPEIVFTKLKLFNEPVQIAPDSILPQHIQYLPKIRFNHTQEIFSIHFAALDFMKPRKNQYAYQLIGFDKDLVYVDSQQRFATYTNLPAGEYTFFVKASNNDGIWNEEGKQIQIEVLPPWWETTWAYAFYTLIVVWFFVDQQRKLQKSRAYNQQLQEIDKLKEHAVQIAQANEQRLRQFLDAIPLGVAILNTDLSVHYMNPTGAKILGVTPQTNQQLKKIAETYQFYVAGTQQLYPEHQLTAICALRGESKVLDNIEVHRPDGNIIPIESRGTPIFDDRHQVKYAIVTFQDIRERKQAETDRIRLVQEEEAKNAALRYTEEIEAKNKQLIHLNQEKNEFLGIAAHDLKNPLGAIHGTAELIHDAINDLNKAELIEYARMIETSSKQMFDLITNLLDVNAIESGKINMRLIRMNMLPIVETVINNYAMAARNKHIHVHFNPAIADYPAYLDSQVCSQVLDNIISNAIKYSPAKANVYIRLRITPRQTVCCEVQDEGQGLNAEDLHKLFGKFTRLTPRPTAGEHSTGLGLFIVKKLVDAMRGRVWCESQLGKGTTFFVEFQQIEQR